MPSHRYSYRPPPKNHPALLRAVRVSLPVGTPDSIDLRCFMLPVRDQGQEGCCSGFSTAAMREASIAATGGTAQSLSPAYLYARTRMTEGTFPQDAGATIADEVATLENYGVCPEADLPYSGDASEAPDPQDDVQAVLFRCGPPQIISHSDPAFLEAALAHKQAVVFGMPVYSSFEDTGSDGLVAIPNAATEQCLGGHAMLAVGYNRPAQRLTVRNSWSASWGSAGYCYLPYSMILSFFEAWAIPLLP